MSVLGLMLFQGLFAMLVSDLADRQSAQLCLACAWLCSRVQASTGSDSNALAAGPTVSGSMPNGEFSSTWRGPSLEQVLVALPAAVALGLASLYTLGALLCAAELRHEGVELTNGLKLLPLEQVLARGIGSAILIAAGVGLTAWLIPLLWHWDRQVARRLAQTREQDPSASVADHRAILFMTSVFCGALAVALLLFAPILVALVTAFFLVRLAWSFHSTDLPPRVLPTAAAMFVFAGAACIGQAFVNPRPLPEVSVTEAGRAVAHGRLVVISSDAWYVTNRVNRITAIPTSRVVATHVRLQPHKVWTLFNAIVH